MKRIILVLASIVLLGSACLQPSGGKTATAYDATQDTKITNLEGIILGPNGLQTLVSTINNKISGISDIPSLISRVSAIDSRVSVVEGKVGTSSGGGVSQAAFDALAARVKVLEDWKASGGSTSGGGSLDPTDGAIVSSHGNLQLILERAVEEEVWVDDNVNQTWRLTVRNNGTSSTYFRINSYFDCEESVAITSATLVPDFSGTSAVQCTPTSVGASTINTLPFLFTSTGSSNKVYIGKSREESLFLTLKIDYASAVGKRWTWDFSIREVN